MNCIFISPNFPKTYWNFCDRLKRNGANVLGIGDCPYDDLLPELKNALTEYYKVDSMENYEEMFRAVAFFSFKYGKIDFLESNNEYWLEQDARLRTDFHITTGKGEDEIAWIKNKSLMKKVYLENQIPTARQHIVTDLAAAEAFIETTGYPVIVKPDIGVGAMDTYKLTNEAELAEFYANKPAVPYVMEEFIEGNIHSYDAIIDSKGEPLFESMNFFPPSIMDIVIKQTDLYYYVAADVPEALRKLGRKTVKAFDVRSRFVHLEFFSLAKDKPGLGKKGDFVALEVNMRPAGGYTPDMINYAHSTDVYQIWADMVTADRRCVPENGDDHYCAYVGRRDCHTYVHSHEEIMDRYGENIVMQEEMPEMNWPQMGNYMYTAKAKTEEDAWEFIHFALAQKEN